MAEKMSTMSLKVDMECSKCYNKLRRTLCEYHYYILSQTVDRNQGTITITGPFDPKSFSEKLTEKAGKAIKGIEIKKEEEKTKVKKPAGDETLGKEKEAKQAGEKPPGGAKPNKGKKQEISPGTKAAGVTKPGKGNETKEAVEKTAVGAKSVEGKEQEEIKDKKAAGVKENEAKQADQKGAEPVEVMKMVEPTGVHAYSMVQPYSVFPVYDNNRGMPGYDEYGRPILYDHGYPDYGHSSNNNHGYNNIDDADNINDEKSTCNIM